MTHSTEKLLILLVAFVLFLGGVYALSMDRGDARTITLTCIVVALLCIAVGQTIRRLKKKE